MKRVFFLFAIAMVLMGCSSKTEPQPSATVTSGMKTGKPDADEARQCVASFLADCGYSHVEIRNLQDQPNLPSESKVEGEAWAYQVSMECTDILGGRRQNDGWTVVVQRKEGRPVVLSCFDREMKKVSGETAQLTSNTNPEPDTTPTLVIPNP